MTDFTKGENAFVPLNQAMFLRFPLYLNRERWGCLYLPKDVTKTDIELMRKQLSDALAIVDIICADAIAQQEPSHDGQ